MKNYVNEGCVVTATAPYDVASGAGALIGSMFGVATATIASGATGEFSTDGVFDLARESGSSTAPTEGAKAYWDNSNKRVTKTSTSNTLIGVFVLPLPVDADTTARVRLNGSF